MLKTKSLVLLLAISLLHPTLADAANIPVSVPGKTSNPQCSTSSNANAMAKISVLKNANKNCQVFSKNLIALWKFEGSDLGLDTLGHLNLTSQGFGSPQQASGKFGMGLLLQGGAYIGLLGAINGLPSGNASYSFSAWIKPDGLLSDVGGIVAYGENDIGKSNSLRLDGFSGIWHYWYANDFGFQASDSLVGNWNHIASTYDAISGIRNLYLNGQLMNSNSPSSPPIFSSSNLMIGKTTNDSPFSGLIDEVAIFDTALSQAQIRQVMNGNYS